MPEILRVEHLRAGYGEAIVIDDVSFALGEGRSLALLGRNGAGKTTLLSTLVGTTRQRGGQIALGGQIISGLRPDQRAQAGIGWVPQERNIFKSLTVEQTLCAVARPGLWTPPRVFEQFPRLAERRTNCGGQLSGGDQKIVAIGRPLVLNPRLLLLDEPLEGLAPIIVEELLAAITRIVRGEGLSAIIVEQHPLKVLRMTDEALVLERGRTVLAAPSSELLAEPSRLEAHLAVKG